MPEMASRDRGAAVDLQGPVEEVILACADAHKGRFQMGLPLSLVVCLVPVAMLALFSWLTRGINDVIGVLLIGPWASIFFLYPVLVLFNLSPNLIAGELPHWNRPARPQHLRCMELNLPPRELQQWRKIFSRCVQTDTPVTVKDLVMFANSLRDERIRKADLRAQQVIFDQARCG